MKWLRFASGTALTLAMALLASGCIPGGDGAGQATPNRTLAAISQMLTETSAVPTPTLTPILLVTPTQTLTPVPTPLSLGDEKLPGKLGEPLDRGGTQLTVLSAAIKNSVGQLKALKGSAYLDTEVLVANTAAQTALYSPQYFKIIGPSGQIYSPASQAQWPELQSGDLLPREQVRGHVAFEVPANAAASDFHLQYQPHTGSNQSTEVWIALNEQVAQVPKTGGSFEGASGLPGVGERVESGGIALVIDQIATSRQVGKTKPSAGNIYVTLQVMIENISHTLAPYNHDYFMVKDADGYEYRPVTIPSDTLLLSGGLQRGQKVSGQVIIEVPENTGDLIVKYLPLVLEDNYKEIRVAVHVPVPTK